MRPALFTLFLFALGTCATAVASVAWPPVQRLFVERAPANTSEQEFARQVGRTLSRFSSRTGFEACAELCRAPNGAWSAQVLTIGAHAACLQTHECPTGRGIHSHPIERRFQANAVDAALWNNPRAAGTWVQAEDPAWPSPSDESAPGYLVVYGQLRLHAGAGRWHDLGPLGR